MCSTCNFTCRSVVNARISCIGGLHHLPRSAAVKVTGPLLSFLVCWGLQLAEPSNGMDSWLLPSQMIVPWEIIIYNRSLLLVVQLCNGANMIIIIVIYDLSELWVQECIQVLFMFALNAITLHFTFFTLCYATSSVKIFCSVCVTGMVTGLLI